MIVVPGWRLLVHRHKTLINLCHSNKNVMEIYVFSCRYTLKNKLIYLTYASPTFFPMYFVFKVHMLHLKYKIYLSNMY